MSTESGSGKPEYAEDLDRLDSKATEGRLAPENARNTAEGELEKNLAAERDGRREDRFLFVVALVVIFDVWALKGVSTWTLPVVVGLVQLFALLIFARRMGVEEIHFWLNQLLPRIRVGWSPAAKESPPPDSERKDRDQPAKP